MLNRKAQALVEFILILPILIMLIFACIDFGRIFVTKSELETLLSRINDIDNLNYDTISTTINNNEVLINLDYSTDGYIAIEFKKGIDIITPGLNKLLSSPYYVKATRMVKYE